MNTHVVIKPFEGSRGRQYKPGEEVDASLWRNVPGLERGRYLRPVETDRGLSVAQQLADLRSIVEDQGRQIVELQNAVTAPKRGRKEVGDGSS